MSEIVTKTYPTPPINEKELLRYFGCKTTEKAALDLLKSCIKESENVFSFKVCYRQLPITRYENTCDFGVFKAESVSLCKRLEGCESAIVFVASVGLGIDRLIEKYGRISPSKALAFQAIGTERIETLCDVFCKDLEKGYGTNLTPRFGVGYGDLALETQKDIFAALECERKLGVYLNGSLLMSPSKSVTAFVGIGKNVKKIPKDKCTDCVQTDCAFRREV